MKNNINEEKDNAYRWNLVTDYWNKRFGLEGDSTRINLNKIMAELINNSNGTLLDAGCGTGAFTRYISSKTKYNIVGVDASIKAIKIADSLKESKRMSFLHIDSITNLPFHDNSFDIVTLNFVLSDMPDVKSALSEIYRIMKPYGKIIISLIHPVATIELIERKSENRYKQTLFKRNRTYKRFTIKNYFLEQKGLYHWTRSLSTNVYHRTIQYYFNHITTSGFEIESLLEPSSFNKDVYYRKDIYVLPKFIIFSGRKKNIDITT